MRLRIRPWMAMVAVVTILAGLLFGYDQGVISGALGFVAIEFGLSSFLQEVVTSWVTVGALFGALVAEIVDAVLSSSGDWRLMLGLAAVPGFLLLVVAWVMPETPRWLVRAGRSDAAKASLEKTRGPDEVDERVAAIAADLEGTQEGRWRDVFAPSLRRALWVGVGLAIFQQVTGINAIIYYANEIFDAAGFTTPQEQADATLLAVGCVNVLATFIAIAFIDRFGRRPLLLTGLVGMGVSLTAVGVSFLAFDETSTGGVPSVVGIVTLIALVVYIASFAFSLGPVVWTVISEIYPNRVRGRAVAVATAVNWAAAFLVSQSFLSLLDAIGTTATFLLFAAMCAVSGIWIARNVPETKGRTLEEIEQIFETVDVAG